jgi:hypothetical protein
LAFADWCDRQDAAIRQHEISLLSAQAAHLQAGRDMLAAVVPTHYASEERIAGLLARLGKPQAAQFIREKLPESRQIRSGDLGEILATEFVAEEAIFVVPIRRLRWKDHRNMAMRGDDLIAVRVPPQRPPLEFLKCETKSRANLASEVVVEARAALDKDRGLPAPHALAFVADRLRETGNQLLADMIDSAQLENGILPAQVSHLLFVFCGNNPNNILNGNLQAYRGAIEQTYVGFRVTVHQQFIKDVYDQVIANGHQPG